MMRPAIVNAVALLASLAQANEPAPVALQPNDWLGVDGNWSTLSFKLGSNSQAVSVLVSTSLSEFWAVGPGGCITKEPHCSAARGGVYTPTASKKWTSMGIWQLGLDFLGFGGNGEYGCDSISAANILADTPFDMSGVLMAAVNSTDYFNGLFGLGTIQSSFNDETVVDSPLTQAVNKFGLIPSYSYGYTAGASYRNTPVSVTLGGYDSSRFVQHNTAFTLGQTDGLAKPLVRRIEVGAVEGHDPLDSWGSRIVTLSSWNTSFNALIDSTTPYLWLPDEVCDSFAVALNLTYNDTFQLYTLDSDRYREYSKQDTFSFTFVLSSFDNTDDIGDPYNVDGVVNITVSSSAFVGLLEYPFRDEAIKYGDPAVPYFRLRRTHSSTFIIGRSFLQEAYLLTKYDEGVYSIHQARFPDDPLKDMDISAIQQSADSPYPGPKKKAEGKLSKGQMAGIAVGVVVACLVALLAWFCHRRRKSQRNKGAGAVDKDAPSIEPDTPKSPMARILYRITRLARSPKPDVTNEKASQQPSEVPNSEIYELPAAPVPPAELGGDDRASLNGDTELGTELGTDSSQNMSAYELARRKLERQRQGPVPAYTPPSDGSLLLPEKTVHDISPPDSGVRIEQPSPTSLPTRSHADVDETNPDSLSASLPSPITTRVDLQGRPADFPSPITSTISVSCRNAGGNSGPSTLLPVSSHGNSSEATCRSDSVNLPSPISSTGMSLPAPSSPVVQRTPIDPSKVVYLGPLPESVHDPRNNSPSRTPEAMSIIPVDNRSLESLGSNFTEEEERRVEEIARQNSPHGFDSDGERAQQSPAPPTQVDSLNGTTDLSTPRSQERINPGTELIHVPQMAERRYSWEEER